VKPNTAADADKAELFTVTDNTLEYVKEEGGGPMDPSPGAASTDD